MGLPGIDKIESINQIFIDLNLDPVANQALAKSLSRLWDSFNDKALVYPRLQDWYVRRQCYQNLLGGIWAAVDYKQADVDRSLDQFTEHLQALYKMALAEIERLEKYALASRAPSSGVMLGLPPVRWPGRLGAGNPYPNPWWRRFGGGW